MQQQKTELREDIQIRLSRMSEKDQAAESRSVSRRLLELLPSDPVTICAYVPLPDEVDIRPFLEELLQKNYPLYLPRFEGNALVFRQADDLSNLERGALNIHEPSAESPKLDPSHATHIIIPGRAFDRSGGRLGRGNGG